MKYRMKCVITNPQEPFFTEGKEYQIFHNKTIGYFIKDDDGTTSESGKTRGKLLNNLNDYYYSQFELIKIEEPNTNKVLLTLDVKEVIQAKIDALTTEAEHLLKKRDRLEQQARILLKKRRKLNKLINYIKEFE